MHALQSKLEESAHEYLSMLVNLKDDGNTLTLIVVVAVMFVITIQFIRYVWNFFYPSQPIEDLLHFKAAPAGYSICCLYTMHPHKVFNHTSHAVIERQSYPYKVSANIWKIRIRPYRN